MTQIYKPTNKILTETDMYVEFKEYIGAGNRYKVTLKVFRDILKDYMKYISSTIIDRGAIFTPLYSIGSIFVGKRKITRHVRERLRVDFKATKELGKTVLHLNEHSNGYNYMFRWRKKESRAAYVNMYELIMSRHNKRELAKSIKENRTDYLEY